MTRHQSNAFPHGGPGPTILIHDAMCLRSDKPDFCTVVKSAFAWRAYVIWKLPCSGLSGQLRKNWLEQRCIPSPLPSPSWERETELNPWLKAILGPGAVPPPYCVHSGTCQAHWNSWPLCLIMQSQLWPLGVRVLLPGSSTPAREPR